MNNHDGLRKNIDVLKDFLELFDTYGIMVIPLNDNGVDAQLFEPNEIEECAIFIYGEVIKWIANAYHKTDETVEELIQDCIEDYSFGDIIDIYLKDNVGDYINIMNT